jgi:hypothetical protein
MRWLLALTIVLLCSADGRAQQPKPPLSTDDWNRVSDLQMLLEHDHRNCSEMAKPLPAGMPGSKPKPYLECMREKGWIRK